ncbi:hypothetical protein, partial [Halomonas llamarensis]
GDTTISQVMAETQVSGTHDIHFRDKRGNQQQATLSVKHAKLTMCPPIGKQKKYQKQALGVVKQFVTTQLSRFLQFCHC